MTASSTWLLIGMVALSVCAAVSLAVAPGRAEVAFALFVATQVTAAAAAVLAARRSAAGGPRSARLGWLCLSLYQASVVAGLFVSMAEAVVAGAVPTGANAADLFYLLASVLGVGAVLFLGSDVWARVTVRVLLDSGIVSCAVLAMSWLAALEAAYLDTGQDTLSFLVSVAYPAGDVLTAVLVLSTLAHARRVDPSLLLVGAAMLTYASGDSAYAYLHYPRPGVFDALYPAANSMVAIASLTPAAVATRDHGRHLAWWQVLLPYGPLALAVGMAGAHIAFRGRLDPFSQSVMGGLVALVMIRQLVAVFEGRSLTSALAGAIEEQRVVIEQAPVGICRLDRDGRMLSVNRSLAAMLHAPASRIEGRSVAEFVHGDDLDVAVRAVGELFDDASRPVTLEVRGSRDDGVPIWWSATIGPLPGAGGEVERLIAVVEETTDRKRALLRAAAIQERLLPQRTPSVPGYELAGACRPAEDVAGDFYDWMLAADGSLEVTVADVIGKGIAAALVMAVLRTALRSLPGDLGPAERLGMAARSMTIGSAEDGLFVTVFHGRLDPLTGRLRYVDAGHGHCAILRAGGRLERLAGRSLPMGVEDPDGFSEQETVLEPGDVLLVHSDGLIELRDHTVRLADLAPALRAGADATDMVARLLAATPSRPADDVTVVVLRRQPGAAQVSPAGAAGSRGAGPPARAAS